MSWRDIKPKAWETNTDYFVKKKKKIIICLRYKVRKPNSGKVDFILTSAKSSVDEGIWRIRIIFTDIQANWI